MSVTKAPRDILADKIVKMIFDIGDVIDKYIPDDEALDFTCLIHSYARLAEYMAKNTNEQLEKAYIMETVYWPKCPIGVTDEQIEQGYDEPLKELCPYKECPEHNADCWGTYRLTPPGTHDAEKFFYGNPKFLEDEK